MVSHLLSQKGSASLGIISGYDIPVMANSEESKLILMIARLFNPKVKDVDKKSYLVWIIPLSAILIFILRLFLKENRIYHLIIGGIGCILFLFAAYKLKTTNLAKPGLQVHIAFGIWLMLWAYLITGIASSIDFLRLKKH